MTAILELLEQCETFEEFISGVKCERMMEKDNPLHSLEICLSLWKERNGIKHIVKGAQSWQI
jgi:hypothetical protein